MSKLLDLIDRLSAPSEEEAQLLQAREVASRTEDLLATRGWCLWECEALNQDIIVVARDELIDGYPQGYPVYTRGELELLSNVGESTRLLVHEVKKITRAVVMDVTQEVSRVANSKMS